MDESERLKIYKTALVKYEEDAQINMVYEELGELMTALSRFKRGRATRDDVLTELADVSIMVEQIGMLICYDDFKKEKDKKLIRLKERLGRE